MRSELREGVHAGFLVRLRDGAAAHTVNLPAKRVSFSGDKHGVICASAEGKK
jgi:hypothetical protein